MPTTQTPTTRRPYVHPIDRDFAHASSLAVLAPAPPKPTK